MAEPRTYLYKGGRKLAHALESFRIDVSGMIAADLGCNVGGFTDCLLQHGARRVYAVDTGYGILAWKLRQDERVTVCERTNALHWEPPEPLDLVVIDVGWTRQNRIIPRVFDLMPSGGSIVSLFKPQYEADESERVKGVVPEPAVEDLLRRVVADLSSRGFEVTEHTRSALRGGSKGKGNVEYFLYFKIP